MKRGIASARRHGDALRAPISLILWSHGGSSPVGRSTSGGTGATSIYLASRGFEVTGIDFAPAAIGHARKAAAEAGVTARFLVDDVTSPTRIPDRFGLLVDHGTFDDLSLRDRVNYVTTATRIAEKSEPRFISGVLNGPSRWERWLTRAIPIGNVNVEPGEVERRFSRWWSVEQIASSALNHTWPRRSATYLMRRDG